MHFSAVLSAVRRRWTISSPGYTITKTFKLLRFRIQDTVNMMITAVFRTLYY